MVRYGTSRSFFVLALLAILILVGVSAIFSVSRFRFFFAHPALMPSPGPVPEAFFGMTLNHLPSTPWPSIPLASLRTWDTAVNWADIQPTPDNFVWSHLDAMINRAQKHGVDLLFTLGRTPRWASASPDAKSPYGPGQCAPPANIQSWEEFLRAVLMHAPGKIRFWETWNEPQSPDSVFYCGDVSTMVELQQRTYETIKAIDPSAMVLTPSAVGGYGPSWMSRFLAGGGGKFADIMAFHGYLAPSANAESIIDTITDFKAVFEENGQKAKPVWDTEASWGQYPALSNPDQQAAFLAKFYILHWSAGIDRFYWYAYDNEEWGTLWDAKNGLHQAGIAYREVRRWLEGATMTSPCVLKQSRWTCNLTRDNGYRAVILWNSADASAPPSRISMPGEFRQYRDLAGNMQIVRDGGVLISHAPILVETTAAF
jgi:hypothetical protein